MCICGDVLTRKRPSVTYLVLVFSRECQNGKNSRRKHHTKTTVLNQERNVSYPALIYITARTFSICVLYVVNKCNKANLRDLIAATGLVISNWIQIVIFSARVTVKFDGWPRKTNRAFLLYYVKLCASFQIHWWIQTGFTVQKRSIRVEKNKSNVLSRAVIIMT